MQGFDPQTILPRIAAQGLERQEIRPGVTLAAVRSDGVELSVGGAPQKVALAERSAMRASLATRTT